MMPKPSFWSVHQTIPLLQKPQRPIQVLGIGPELLVQKSDIAQGAATNQHRATGCARYLLTIVELTAVNFLPATVPYSAGPQTKISTRVPKLIRRVSKIYLWAD